MNILEYFYLKNKFLRLVFKPKKQREKNDF